MSLRLPRIPRTLVLSAVLMPAGLLAQGTAALPLHGPTAYAPGIPYVTNPYGGMFGSMGNIYSPYYRQFHQPVMSGPFTGATNIPGMHYNVNPYAGMYGSMGNVYSPYYRQFHQLGMGGMAGAPIPGAVPGQGIRYHYPYFMPPTMGAM